MQRTVKKVIFASLLLLVIGVVGDSVLLMLGMLNSIDVSSYRNFSDTYIVKTATTENIDLIINSGNVRIVRADVDRPTIRIWRWVPEEDLQREMIKEEVQGDELKLVIDDSPKHDSRFWLLPFNYVRNHFEVLLPQREFRRVAIDINSGNGKIENLDTGTLILKMKSGRFRMENCRADEISLESDSGHFDMIDCFAGKVSGKISSGYAQFKDIKGKLDISNSSGHIEVAMAKIFDDVLILNKSGFVDANIGHVHTPFRIVATASSGVLDINLPNLENQISDTSSFQGTVGQGEGPLFKVEVRSGRIKIR